MMGKITLIFYNYGAALVNWIIAKRDVEPFVLGDSKTSTKHVLKHVS